MRMAHMFEILVPSWWHRLGKIRRCALVGGGVSMGMGFEVPKRPCHSQLALSRACVSRCKLSVTAPAPSLPVAMPPAMMVMESNLGKPLAQNKLSSLSLVRACLLPSTNFCLVTFSCGGRTPRPRQPRHYTRKYSK